MSDPLAQAEHLAAQPQWGVWDNHLRDWVATGHATEREAWAALLAADSLHPWELAVAEQQPKKPASPPLVDCGLCGGAGDCPTCEQTCPACDGTGQVEEEPPRRRLAAVTP